MFDIEEIMRNIPHRYPFLLIDKIIDFKKNKSVTVLKNITINEAQFQGHFPNKPIFPGVYIIENMAQSACFLITKSNNSSDENKIYYLGKVNKMSFLHPVQPGDQLITSITVEKMIGKNAFVSAHSKVEDKIVAKGELFFAEGNNKEL